MSAELRRQALALLLSLLVHALLLSLIFGGEGLGPPGFAFPWRERRIEAPTLRVMLVPRRGEASELLQKVPVERSVADRPSTRSSAPSAVVLRPAAVAIVPGASPRATGNRTAEAATGVAPAKKASSRVDPPGDVAPLAIPAPPVIAVARPNTAPEFAPGPPAVPAPAAAVPNASSSQTADTPLRDTGDAARERTAELAELDRARQEARQHAEALEAARQDAARQEAARLEAARLEAEREEVARQEVARQDVARQDAASQEAARLEAARLEAVRQEAARQDAARQEVARQEVAQQEAARQEVARQEVARQEVARQEAARLESARQEAVRQDAVRQEAARQEAARQEAARQEAARQEAARQEAARAAERREERLRAIGRQLDEEAARRDAAPAAARQTPSLPLSLSSARRGRLLGRTDPNTELVRYAEAWARKIELNMAIDMVREVARQPHRNPMVTVAIRSDGSVESVTFVVSSGVAEIDEAVRRIVESQRPYPPFPPGLAREFDVIEIRRTWHFDVAVRLY
jgi:TonB family protein